MSVIYKYVPVGDTPPERITFYGYSFLLNGPGVEVTNAAALAKMEHNPSFLKLASVPDKPSAGPDVDPDKPVNPNKGKPRPKKKESTT